jgi:hypothetical protein
MQLDAIINYRYILTLYLSKFANENRIIFRMWPFGAKADPLQLALQLSMSTEEVKLQVEMISGGWSAPGTSFWSTHVVPLPKRVAFQVQN